MQHDRNPLLNGDVALATFAAAVNRTARTVHIWINQGLPVHHVGRAPFVPVDEAYAWLAGRKKGKAQVEAPPPRKRGRPPKKKDTNTPQ